MLAARFVVGGVTSPMLRCSFTKVNSIAKPNSFRSVSWRQFAEDARETKTWGRRRRSLKEVAMQPAGETCEFYFMFYHHDILILKQSTL